LKVKRDNEINGKYQSTIRSDLPVRGFVTAKSKGLDYPPAQKLGARIIAERRLREDMNYLPGLTVFGLKIFYSQKENLKIIV
jgi:hypothetical protein